MDKNTKMWINLYFTLTSSQIEKALRTAGLTHQDWMDFCKHMKSEGYESKKSRREL